MDSGDSTSRASGALGGPSALDCFALGGPCVRVGGGEPAGSGHCDLRDGALARQELGVGQWARGQQRQGAALVTGCGVREPGEAPALEDWWVGAILLPGRRDPGVDLRGQEAQAGHLGGQELCVVGRGTRPT